MVIMTHLDGSCLSPSFHSRNSFMEMTGTPDAFSACIWERNTSVFMRISVAGRVRLKSW